MRKLFAVPVFLFAQSVWAAPFDECPAQAFLTQGSVAQTYAVNLVTGDYRIQAETMGTTRAVNGLGFNPVDQYIYGWGYEYGLPVRVHNDFTVEPLQINNISGANFYVGDVHPDNNHYYVYRKGSSFGLYAIQLDPEASDYLEMRRVIDGSSLSMSVADMAINPADGMGYAVSSRGELFRFDVETGDYALLSNIGERGVFGAAYFDPDGNLYVGRNSDGSIFRIAIGDANFSAELFASGPSSSINDGSRCATAPVVDASDTQIDFGDAPDSYGTYLESNGARHGLTTENALHLGDTVDGEADSSAYPLSDDSNDSINDEDGIQFATSIVESESAVVIVNSSGTGFINAWIDLEADGQFDYEDQVLTDYPVSAGKQAVYVDIPPGVTQGKTWARFRLSTRTGLQPKGGVADGEVEDYQVEILEKEATVNYYPSATGWTTVAFEDNWPLEGDYDMNDLVVYLRNSVVRGSSGIKQVNIKGEIAAVGAAYHNGFAVRLPGVKYSQVDIPNVSYKINGRNVDFTPIEGGRDEAILIVTYNLWDYTGTGEHCLYFRTEPGCGSSIQMTFEAEIPMQGQVNASLSGVLDPFLFATPGAWHGGHFVTAPGRAYEIHMKNQDPTEAFDPTLFDQPGEDASNPASGIYFQTANGLPWALEVGTRWEYPTEYSDIGRAYTLFSEYAKSGGLTNSYWFNPDYTNRELIFTN